MARIIDGKAISAKYRDQVAADAAEFRKRGVVPHLAVVLVGDDPASAVYVRNKRQGCEKAGMKGTLHQLSKEASEKELLDLIARLNADRDVHGILVQLPLPKQINPQHLLDAVTPLKDVDCFHPENVGMMVQGRPRFLPCTPAGVQKLLIDTGVRLAGAHVVILGRSEIVGKPLANMLVQKGPGANATVTVCHSQTRDLVAVTRAADVLIAAIGVPGFVKAEHLKPGVVVIDVGINRVGEKLTGDVDFASVSTVASAITPVPGGVGPMTIAMLLRNTLTAAQLQSPP